jgi:hypothetical protein
MDYEEFLVGLVIDLVAISVLTYALYFHRHQRRDLTLGFMGINVGLFAVSSFTAATSIGIGFGIGLFALLSVIRLRSTTTSQEEIGYYFVALVIGLVNGLAVGGGLWNVTITLNIVLLLVMFVADHPRMLRHAERRVVIVKGVPRSPEKLRARLEDRLGYEVTRVRVQEIDYASRRTHLDVRFRTDRPVERRKSNRGSRPQPLPEGPPPSPGEPTEIGGRPGIPPGEQGPLQEDSPRGGPVDASPEEGEP